MKKIILRSLAVIGILILLFIGVVIYSFVVTTQEKVITTNVNYTGMFSYAPSGHLLIDVYINGSDKPYPFIIDNAATTIIFDNLLEELDLNRVAFLPTHDANKNISIGSVYRIDTIKLENGIVITDIASKCFSSNFFACNDNVYGLIGKEVLENFVWQFNFKEQTYAVTSDRKNLTFSEDTIEIPFDSASSYHDLIVIKINDNQKQVVDIDLGSTGGIKYELEEDSLDYFYKNKNIEILGLTSYGLNGDNKRENKTSYVFMDSIRIDGNQFYNLESRVANKALNIVGLEFFKNFRTTLDFPNKLLILEPNDSLNFYSKHFGIAFKMEDKKLRVSSLIENTAPHQFGIKIGDEVLKLNNLKVDDSFDYCNLDYYKKDTLRVTINAGETIKEYIIAKQYLFN